MYHSRRLALRRQGDGIMNAEERAWKRYVANFRRNSLQELAQSAVCLSLYSGDGSDFDVKQATELGAILLLDRPMILLLAPGARVPTRLAKAADFVIEEWDIDNPLCEARLQAILDMMIQE